MSHTAGALLALIVLVSLMQWLWTVAAGHYDLQLIPAASMRRRAEWLLHNSLHIQLGLGAFALCAAAALLVAPA